MRKLEDLQQFYYGNNVKNVGFILSFLDSFQLLVGLPEGSRP